MLYPAEADEEMLTIGIVAPSDEARSLRYLVPDAIWYRYDSLEAMLRLAEGDKLDVLLIDASCVEPGEHTERCRGYLAPADDEIVNLLRCQCPVLVAITPGRDVPWWTRCAGVAVLKKPVSVAELADLLTARKSDIRMRRLERLFRKVAVTYSTDLEWR